MMNITIESKHGEDTMNSTLRMLGSFLAGVAFFSFSWMHPATGSADVCSQGTGLPPFLSAGADPNLLLLLDNSGSMLDLAYVDNTEQCFDDTYSNASLYAGYFERTSWYSYDFINDSRFEMESSDPAVCATSDYYAEDGSSNKYVCVDLDSNGAVTSFVATGNFMNWLSVSKFDVQKEILTGGKYDDVNQNLQMESRGCMDKRFVKQVSMAQGDYKLALGVRGPMEVYNTWLAETDYTAGTVVIFRNILYKAQSTHESSDEFATDSAEWDEYKETRWYSGQTYPANTAVYDVENDGWYWTQSGGTSSATGSDVTADGNMWVPYDGTSIEIFSIEENGFQPSACQQVMTLITGLTGTALDGDSSDDKSSLGQIKALTEECMGFSSGGGNTVETARKTSFNHAMQECWYYNKFGIWQPGGGTVTSMKSACENVYDFMNPGDITPWDSSYVCSGTYQPVDDKADLGYVGRCWEEPGDPGTCTQTSCTYSNFTYWESGSEEYVCYDNVVRRCNKLNCNESDPSPDSNKEGDWDILLDCSASGGGDLDPADWTNDNFYFINPCSYKSCDENDAVLAACTSTAVDFTCTNDSIDWTCHEVSGDGDEDTDYCHASETNGDLCVEQAIKDFCGILDIPEVIDPSDATTATGEVWNAPAYLIDSAVMAQLDLPLITMRGYVQQADSPEGVLHSTASKLRIGAMAFNENGAETECAAADKSDALVKYCPDTNEDGAQLLSPIKGGMTRTGGSDSDPIYHIDDLTVAINDIRATSWTPLAEAVYNALGYYGQNTSRRLNPDDFIIESEDSNYPDPIQYWCQGNYLLIITEGSSTADIDNDIVTMVADMNIEDTTVLKTNEGECVDSDNDSVLYASTFLDDLTYFGQNAAVADLYSTPSATPGQMVNDDGELHDKQNISTYIVSTGVLRDDGTDSECNPATLIRNAAENGGTTLLTGENPDALEANLTQVLSEILSRASAGSAASVISSSRSGSGAVYQAIFWPELTDNQSAISGDDNTVTWVGDVHSLFMSSSGLMYEDTNQDGKLSPLEDLNNNGVVTDLDAYGDPEDIGSPGENGSDKRLIFYFSANANKTRACYNITDFLTGGFVCPDDPVGSLCQPGDDCVEIQDVKYLWSAADKLRNMDPADRNIWTWNDANNDGIVNGSGTSAEWFQLNSSVNWSALNTTAAGATHVRGPVTEDFLTSADWFSFVDNDNNTDTELEDQSLDALADWIRGTDQLNNETTDDNSNGRLDKQLRSRQFFINNITKEWRLGDIIHSTPIVVAKPAEAYHYIYRDASYGYFSKRWAKRRNMVYFGANDGMLHAVNGGFYFEHLSQFCCTNELDTDETSPNYMECLAPVVNGTCTTGDDLGDELWAYIPYNLQPHLKCLTDQEYSHKYFVDQKPRIFDVQIFPEEGVCQSNLYDSGCIHAGGWGTILVGSMRFGGAPVEASSLNGNTNDTREFTSSFFILDITNPESAPVLLGEMTRTTGNEYVDLNYTTSSPSLVVMRDSNNFSGDVFTDWYLVMGNGPTEVDGTNDVNEQGKLAILPLKWLTGGLSGWGADGIPVTSDGILRAFQIPNKRPDGGAYTMSSNSGEGGVFVVPEASTGESSYVSDIITVDFDIENTSLGTVGALYKADAVYFGTTDGEDFTTYPAPDNDENYWNGGGRLFRLVTKKLVGTDEEYSLPSEWAGLWPTDNDPVRLLVDAKEPITAAPSVGYDGDNFWVYAGTGRFYDKKDKTDNGKYDSGTIDNRSKVSYFGIKEPVDVSTDCYDGILTWAPINWDINSNDNNDLDPNATPGNRGLMQVDNILVAEELSSKFVNVSFLECAHCVDNEDNPNNPTCTTSDYDCFPTGFPTSTVTYADNDQKTESDVATFADLRDYIAGTGCVNATSSSGVDGWYRDFHEPRERNLGQAALLGGLLTFTGYKPYNDICQAEGVSFLYGVHYQTGTAWTGNVFGTFNRGGDTFVMEKISLGRGLATTPSMHVGTGDQGATAFVQTSTGEIIEIQQEELPVDNVKSGRSGWSDRCSP